MPQMCWLLNIDILRILIFIFTGWLEMSLRGMMKYVYKYVQQQFTHTNEKPGQHYGPTQGEIKQIDLVLMRIVGTVG